MRRSTIHGAPGNDPDPPTAAPIPSLLDWRELFRKYVEIVGREEGVDFLYPDDWNPEEWEEISKLRSPEPTR